MKVKQTIHITNVDEFIRGDYDGCFTLFDHESRVEGWIALQEIEIEVNLDLNDLRAKAIKATDREIEALQMKMSAEMKRLTDRKQELLALTYEPAA